MVPLDVNGKPIRPPKDPAQKEKMAKIFGLVAGIMALLGLIAVVLMLIFFVILPKGDYKGAAEKGFSSGTSQSAGTTETGTTTSTEQSTKED